MSYTPVQVCNLALAKVGDESAQITSIPATPGEDYSKEANLCSKFYGVTLREVLAIHPWNCAKKRVALALDEESPVYGWEYKFSMPADCARPVRATSVEDTDRTFRYNSEWVVESGKILSNHGNLWLSYIQNMENLANADALFIKTLYTALAIKLVYPLTESRNLTKDIMNELETVILPEARRVNGFSGYEMPTIDSAWVEATYNSFSGIPTQRFAVSDENYGTI